MVPRVKSVSTATLMLVTFTAFLLPAVYGSVTDDLKGSLEDIVRDIIREEMDSVMPIGFIYIQYPFQSSPETIWPKFNWTDVSNTYTGHFFRVAGGNAAPFETEQNENSPRLSHVNSRREKATGNSEKQDIDTVVGGISARVWTGDDKPGRGELISTSFVMSGGEVRPKNYAVRVWKRVASDIPTLVGSE